VPFRERRWRSLGFLKRFRAHANFNQLTVCRQTYLICFGWDSTRISGSSGVRGSPRPAAAWMASWLRRPAFAARPSVGSLTAATPAAAEPAGCWCHQQRRSAPCSMMLNTSSGEAAASVAPAADTPWNNSSCSRQLLRLGQCARKVVSGVWIRERIDERWWELTWALKGGYFSRCAK
jgi:hypothetical protein